MPARRFSDEQEKEICKLYADGKSSLEIGEKYNCSYRTIFNILKRNNAESRGVELNGGEQKISEGKRTQISKEYQAGKSISRLAKDHKVSTATAYRILKDSGIFVPFQNSEQRTYRSKRELICREYQDGKGIPDLTAKHQMEEQVIRRILREANLLVEPHKAARFNSQEGKRGPHKPSAEKQKSGCESQKVARPKKVSPITEEIYKECVKRYEGGGSVKSMARELGFTPYHLYRAFRENGFQVKRTFNKPGEEIYEKIVEDYLSGKSVQEIASSCGLTIGPIYDALKRRNIKPPGNALGAEKEQEVCRLYSDGNTTIDISRRLSIHPSTAQKILKKHKVEARPQEFFSDEDAKTILDLYEEGHTTHYLAEIFDCHSTTIQDSIRRVGGELRESRGYQDTVQQAINGEKRFFGKRETSFYVFALSRFPGYLKPGIAFDINDRADMSDGEYGESLLEIVFDCRQAAFMLEQAVLVATFHCADCPDALLGWGGSTELRKIDFDDLVPLIDFYESELNSMGLWSFAVEYVPMTAGEKKQCLQLAKTEGLSFEVDQSQR